MSDASKKPEIAPYQRHAILCVGKSCGENMPLLKFGPINAAITIPVKYPQPILSTKIDRITVSYAVPVRSVEPVTVTQPVLIGCIKPVTGPVLQQVT